MKPSPAEIVYSALLRLLPGWALKPLDAVVASRAYTALKIFQTISKQTARDLIQNAVEDTASLEDKDIVGILGVLIYINLTVNGAEPFYSHQPTSWGHEECNEPRRHAGPNGVSSRDNQKTGYSSDDHSGHLLLVDKIQRPIPLASFYTSLRANQVFKFVSAMRSAKCFSGRMVSL